MFHRLIRSLDLYDGLRLPVQIGRHELLLIHQDGDSWLVQRRCPHNATPLDQGTLSNGVIRCPGHGLAFSLDSGRCAGNAGFCLQRHALVFDGPWLGVVLND